jgi:hypothetical protein
VPVVAALDRRAPPLESLPPAWRGDGAVLCIGGRGPIDDAGATMLAQLVRKHGLGARVALHEAVSRAAIGALDVGPVGAICISYAEATGSPAHLRFLVRRLRQKAPGAVVLLALWRGEAATQDWDDDLLKMTDAAAGSLREMLTRVLDAAAAAEARLAVSA